MPSKVSWTHQARADLLDIFELIGLEQPLAAERYVDRIEALAAMLSDYPRMGPTRPDIASGLRLLVERPYLILYRLDGDQGAGPVDLVRVVDGRRDLQTLF